MSTNPSSKWSGEMLDDPVKVEAFTMQLRHSLSDWAEYVARIRRDAEAMWAANPPAGYSTFEAWWRHRWVTSPFAKIQEHLEEAAKLTFALEARHRKGRHEIPAARQAARTPAAPAIERGAAPAQPRTAAPRLPATGDRPAGKPDFMSMVRGERSA